ncbi:pyridoxamine 5'-phosphate oxidase family protein [Neobacillus ginsengisoli]|uniref:General stress protein 26 n=2 Tax=Neobacillus TaxID=2675232 RepID=A0ABT9XQ37_9BACI|nr:pyridoxamine 5'-phosphate oxidase family protein [Neobacillus ginsengisoli]MCM2535374.1 pyridoxamine 5'-phosphate oxidase family protein [Neobacillus pocheonensis]MDQ0197649.1 general stress protein 26 [Neobacillus ginsengisoli]
MSDQDFKEKVVNIISNHKTGILASVENNKPHSRYMTFYNEDLTLYSPTKKDTEKMDEIENNPYVSVLLGYEEKGQSDAYVEILGTSSINDTEALKNQFWEESFNKWFEGPNDPNYVLLKIQPETVRILNLTGEPPQEFSLKN